MNSWIGGERRASLNDNLYVLLCVTPHLFLCRENSKVQLLINIRVMVILIKIKFA